jgi:glycosyltransferase involved in cell wall biosynthesis
MRRRSERSDRPPGRGDERLRIRAAVDPVARRAVLPEDPTILPFVDVTSAEYDSNRARSPRRRCLPATRIPRSPVLPSIVAGMTLGRSVSSMGKAVTIARARWPDTTASSRSLADLDVQNRPMPTFDEPSPEARRPRILAFAHGLAPGMGSERGVGWIWSRMLSTIGPTVVVARAWPGDREATKAALGTIPAEQRPEVIWVDLPRWTAVWHRAGTTRMQRVEYIIWQLMALRTARRMHRRGAFDIVWHLTWANVWIGSTASLVGPPFVYGPVGGGVPPPWRLVPGLGAKAMLAELLRALSQKVGRYVNPLARISWRRAELVLVQNPETRDWLPADVRSKVQLFPNAVFDGSIGRADHRRAGPRTALFAGRLVAWKGAALAVRAVALCPGWRLIVCGEGPQFEALVALTHELGVEDRVELLGMQPREELLRLLREETDVFLFPSLRDEGPWAVAEAVATGVPVVCLDRGGPPVLGGRAVRATNEQRTVAALAEAMVAAANAGPPPVVQRDLESTRTQLVDLLDARHLLPGTTDQRGS